MQRNLKWKGAFGLFLALSLTAAACGGDDDEATDAGNDTAATEESSSDTPMASDGPAGDTAGGSGAAAGSAEACDADAVVEAVQGGEAEGTLDGMTDDPVATAASNNPVLTTLTAAATEAGLVDTLNSAPALTVFAPTDCAFAGVDPATLDAAMADPTGLLATVVGYHVIPGEQLSAEDLAGTGSLETFTGASLPIEVDGDTITLNGGTATVLVPDIRTANATVHLIDEVMMPAEDAMTATTAAGM